MRIPLFLLLALTLLLSACDRFDHKFRDSSGDSVEAFLTFTADFDSLVTDGLWTNDVAAIMALYTDDYYNNGVDRDSLQRFYASVAATTGTDNERWMLIEVVNPEQRTVRCQLMGSDYIGNEFLLASWYDKARNTPDGYRMCGNGINQPDHAVLVEMFTAVWCPNCPAASEAAHELTQVYPGMVIPVEYIVDDPQHEPLDNDDIKSWYLGSNYAMPVGIFQGQTKVAGGSQSSLSQYPPAVETMLGHDFPLLITGLACTMSGDSLEVTLDTTGSITAANLRLKYAILDETSELHYSSTGDPLTNIVIAKGLRTHDGQAGHTVFRIARPNDLPADAKLVVWFQNVESSWNDTSCPVYNCAQTYLE